MEFALSEEHRLVQSTVREWATSRLLPLAAEMDRSGRYPPELITELGEMGLMGIYIPEAYGGGGMDTVSYCIALEEIARAEAALTAAQGRSMVQDTLFHELLRELMRASGLVRRIGVNLNQAVAKLNATGQRSGDLVPYAAESFRRGERLDAVAEEIRKALR